MLTPQPPLTTPTFRGPHPAHALSASAAEIDDVIRTVPAEQITVPCTDTGMFLSDDEDPSQCAQRRGPPPSRPPHYHQPSQNQPVYLAHIQYQPAPSGQIQHQPIVVHGHQPVPSGQPTVAHEHQPYSPMQTQHQPYPHPQAMMVDD
ncbi:hypothetical protein EST38_g13539 [Candolleomyces aberdarensis]|uniref:Uncharacterized protein n=1 Tax=Candolleomyces aberdarensis TaxID=2316362 RepID=A0A4Q2D0Q6_9AGAR|nr:hypothetical protein EST38_g13539 [Candolleomyces aberdarensis]